MNENMSEAELLERIHHFNKLKQKTGCKQQKKKYQKYQSDFQKRLELLKKQNNG
jgi:hypothetical protein